MANIDYQEAKNEIVKIFSSIDDNNRKIVFWYDAPANFKEDIINDSYDVCRVLLCDKNEFAIKKIIEQEDLISNFLIYVPYERPKDTENWLLDILMYSEEYYADTVALTMRHLGLSNPDLRKVIEKHIKFFDSAQRNKKLQSYIVINDDMNAVDFTIAMMCVLAKSQVRSLESIITELVFDDHSQAKYKDIVKFGFEDFLWDKIASDYNYEGDQKIESLIKKFLFTAMLEQKVEIDDLSSFYKQFIIEGNGKMDAKFFVDRLKQDSRYRNLQFSIATDLRIEGLLANRDISLFESCDIFENIDSFIIKQIADSIRNGSLDYDRFERIIEIRSNSIWYNLHKEEYQLLISSIKFFKLVETGILTDLSSVEYIKEYTENYYLVDYYYRHSIINYNKINNPIYEIECLAERIELFYNDKFLTPLGKEYSKSLKSISDWNFVGVNKSSDFYQKIQKFQFKKLFVIISDGLRYEIGHEIYNEIKSDVSLRGTVAIDYAVSPLPSETRFGMASLLPHKELSYKDGNVFVDEKPTNSIPARNSIMSAKNPGYAAIDYEKINNFSRDELRSYMSDKSLVYIYHNVVDNAGEHKENKVFDVCPDAVNEIVALVKKLYNNLQISNFFITADHGFLYRRNPVVEVQKYGNIVSLKPQEASKRYVISNDDFDIPYTTEFDLQAKNDDNLKVITPYSYDIFKTQGAGVQYVHGGDSLQETIVPVIHISELNAKRGEKISRPVGVRLKSITRKITNRSFALDFEQYEKVEDKIQPVTCVTYITDDDNNIVSGEYHFIANSSNDDINTRITRIRFTLKNIEFDRTKRYYLVLKNPENVDEYIEKEQFNIDIIKFKLF